VDHPLASAEAKIDGATEHLNALNRKAVEFGDTNPYTPVGKFDGEASRYRFKLGPVAPPPVREMALSFGDAVHGFRVALDHLTWQLAIRHLKREPTEKEAKGVQFPIYSTHKGFCAARVLSFVSPDDRKMLEESQPYYPGRDPERHPLAILQKFDNDDKHRFLVEPRFTGDPWRTNDPTAIFSLNEDAGEITRFWICGDALEQDTEVAWVEITAPGPDPQVEMKSLAVQVLLGESPNVYPQDELPGLFGEVVRIVRRFERTF
jgi:hypothetical protein